MPLDNDRIEQLLTTSPVTPEIPSKSAWDLLPQPLHQILWAYTAANGDALPAALTCRQFRKIDADYRFSQALTILEAAEKTDSTLYNLIREDRRTNSADYNFATPSGTQQLNAFNERLVKTLRSLGEKCPLTAVLSAEEVAKFSENIDEIPLKKCWGPLCAQISSAKGADVLPPSPEKMSAQEIHDWMEAHQDLLKCVTRLQLHSLELRRVPKEIGWLENLTELHLSKNAFREFPSVLVKLKKLQHLDLSNNEISELPQNLGDFADLEALLVSNNKLKKVPSAIGRLVKLNHLDLYGNKLSTLPHTIGNLLNLRVVLLRGNPLKSLPATIDLLVNAQVTTDRNVPARDPRDLDD